MTIWDERYRKPGYAYGTAPNEFLASVVSRLPRGDLLSLGEGEGRNAVFLAEAGPRVLAVDGSAVGLAKAQRLASHHGVTITTHHADLADYCIERAAWDAIVSIFCHLPPSLRSRLHRAAVTGLRPGGAFVLEAYTQAQCALGTGGPPLPGLTMSLEDLRRELHGLDFEIARETERDVQEGRCHCGRGAVVQILGIKPAQAPGP